MRQVHTFSIIPLADEADHSNIMWDVYYFSDENDKLGMIRIVNAYVSFMVMQLPGLTIEQTEDYVKVISHRVENEDFQFEIRTDLRDSAYCNCDVEPYRFVEIFSRSPSKLNQLLQILRDSLKNEYYPYLDALELDGMSRIRLKNTQSPFRFIRDSTSMMNSKYILSTEYGIPFIGMLEFDEKILNEFAETYLKPQIKFVDPMDCWILNANSIDGEYKNENINKCFHKFTGKEKSEFNKLTIASYDIETNNPGQKPDPANLYQTIFNIGVGFFHPNSKKPFYRCSIIIGDMKSDEKRMNEELNLKLEKSTFKHSSKILNSSIRYIVRNEYGLDDPLDVCEYICVKNEHEVMESFISILDEHSPHLILSFNGYTFDDIAVWNRLKDDTDLGIRFLQLFTPYDIMELKEHSNFAVPRSAKLDLKLEGKTKVKDRQTIRSPFVQTIDVMFVLKQANAKKFSSSYKLNYMLATFHVKNPFNASVDLLKTGLGIQEMFNHWNNRISNPISDLELKRCEDSKLEVLIDYSNNGKTVTILNSRMKTKDIWTVKPIASNLYDIAHYCCQDAWITGTLLIDRFTLIDKKYMAFATYTSLEDAIYRAVSLRVQTRINGDGYRQKYAVQDILEKEPIGLKKCSDMTYVGGWVRCVLPGRNITIVAADANALYPNVLVSSNITLNTKVLPDAIQNPELFGLKLKRRIQMNDMNGAFHERYLFEKIRTDEK